MDWQPASARPRRVARTGASLPACAERHAISRYLRASGRHRRKPRKREERNGSVDRGIASDVEAIARIGLDGLRLGRVRLRVQEAGKLGFFPGRLIGMNHTLSSSFVELL